MTRPEVTVIIPTRDRWSMLSSCGLPSARSQRDVELEIVVVDDGSTDGTAERLAELDDSRLRIVRQDQARGHAAARNAGIAAARGDWLAFLDDDDLWSPHKLRRQLDRVGASDALMVYAGVVEIDEDGNLVQATVPDATTYEELLDWNEVPAGASNVVALAGDVRAVGGFDERLTYVQDWDLWIRLAARGDIAVVPEVLVAYVRHGGGTRFSGGSAVSEMEYFVAKHRERGIRVDPAEFLWWIATDNRLEGRRRAAASTYLRTALTYRRPRRVLRAAVALLEPRGRKTMRARMSRTQAHGPARERVPWLELYL